MQFPFNFVIIQYLLLYNNYQWHLHHLLHGLNIFDISKYKWCHVIVYTF